MLGFCICDLAIPLAGVTYSECFSDIQELIKAAILMSSDDFLLSVLLKQFDQYVLLWASKIPSSAGHYEAIPMGKNYGCRACWVVLEYFPSVQ
ncbi:hypothetical protein XELAEV_18021145mg [Xenopus laevis]|uniref:Uncharacterized protein n=1 Tax=Xenopus laevis TaxID=8355 RepID=A0A974D8M6_XENLA|nr:hypothetical protein XELAEV_18021145mg [Xenopus laevis]